MKTISTGFNRTNHTIPVPIRTFYPHRYLSFQPVVSFVRASLAKTERHFQWMAITMLVQVVLITPINSIVILSTGNWHPLWFIATASLFAVFVPSLSGLSLKTIKSVFMINCLVSLLIILTAIIHSIIT